MSMHPETVRCFKRKLLIGDYTAPFSVVFMRGFNRVVDANLQHVMHVPLLGNSKQRRQQRRAYAAQLNAL